MCDTDFKGAARALDPQFAYHRLRTVMELEGEAHDEEISRALAASRSLADTAVNVQFDQFKTDLELDQAG